MSEILKPTATDVFCCPICRHEQLGVTKTVQNDGSQIVEAELKCSRCASVFPIYNCIPRFVPRDNYATSFGFQWNIHRKTQLDSCTGLALSRNRLFGVSGWPQEMHGQLVLEAGSGAGRFTEVLLGTGATVVSFDLSDAVDANRSNNGKHPNLHLFQGDIYNLPLRPQSFDKVICLGVIQHTPDPERSFQSLARFVRPGGELVIDVYAKNWRSLLHWKYLLRPMTTRMDKESLYRIIERLVPRLIPISRVLRKLGGRAAHRLIPILEFSHWGLSEELNRQWAILDTFDMYSPAHDHPQTLSNVSRWFKEAGFSDTFVGYGPNGVIARGRRPTCG